MSVITGKKNDITSILSLVMKIYSETHWLLCCSEGAHL